MCRYHDDSVHCIKSYTPPRHSEGDAFIYIIYDECICTLKGSDLIPHLNNLRYNLNRTMGHSLTAASSTQALAEIVDVLMYQKFLFPARDRTTVINDAVIDSTQKPSIFDHFVEECVAHGYYARVSSTTMQSSTVVGVGVEPYLASFHAEEGYKEISLGEVAKDVIGMAYRNILGNLFGRAATPPTPSPEEPSSLLPAKELKMRSKSRFFDGKRDGHTIAIAPSGRLAVIADNLDRVVLVDTQKTTILRVWKGYRDAQCAFVPVKEKTLKGIQNLRRKAIFLVIYAPRFGCLEIWPLQYGPKVAAFTVSKSGQLAYNAHGLLGKSNRKL